MAPSRKDPRPADGAAAPVPPATSVALASELLDVSRTTVYGLIRARELAAARHRRRLLVATADVLRREPDPAALLDHAPTGAAGPLPPVVSVTDAIELLALSRTAIYDLLRAGDIAAAKEGRKWVISTADVYRWAADKFREAGHEDAAARTEAYWPLASHRRAGHGAVPTDDVQDRKAG